MVYRVDPGWAFDEQIQSWDCAFKDLATCDYVDHQGVSTKKVGGRRRPFLGTDTISRIRLDCIRQQKSPTALYGWI